MAVQRKIYHLLQSEGEGKNFRYLMSLRAPFDLTRSILITEKVDGSTMQSRNGEPYKRFDLFKNGDPRKHTASEEERYELRKCMADDSGVKWYLAGFEAHREAFERFGLYYPDFWIYFESLGAKIGARYKDLVPTVRVFDISRNGVFLSFSHAVQAASDAGLPVVHFRADIFVRLENLLEALTYDTSKDYGLPEHKLEGWVLRQKVGNDEIVAKIRTEDLRRIKV